MHAGLLLLSVLLSQVPAVPLPCVQGESTVVCHCKQMSASACAILAEAAPGTLQRIMHAAAVAQAAQEAAEAKEKTTGAVDTGCGDGQDPNKDDGKQRCTGQLHHIISKTVWRALEDHLVLRGLYRYRDPRFVARAKDLKAHCGWQDWHRAVDDEIAAWLNLYRKATPQQFEAYLREVYSRSDLLARFPNGF